MTVNSIKRFRKDIEILKHAIKGNLTKHEAKKLEDSMIEEDLKYICNSRDDLYDHYRKLRDEGNDSEAEELIKHLSPNEKDMIYLCYSLDSMEYRGYMYGGI